MTRAQGALNGAPCENLKYVKPGESAEVALDLYPRQIWKGKVEAIRLEERDPTPAATLP